MITQSLTHRVVAATTVVPAVSTMEIRAATVLQVRHQLQLRVVAVTTVAQAVNTTTIRAVAVSILHPHHIQLPVWQEHWPLPHHLLLRHFLPLQ